MTSSDIRIITTGGTIDAAEIKEDGSYKFAGSSIPKMLEQGGIHIPYTFTYLPPIDSLLMNDDYRQGILKSCLDAPEKIILITHGTDTMVETAQFLHGKITGKTVMLVGAMIPANQANTDAHMNLGFATGSLLTYPQTGVYIAMKGSYFFPILGGKIELRLLLISENSKKSLLLSKERFYFSSGGD